MIERQKIEAAQYLDQMCAEEGSLAPEALRAHLCVTAGLIAHHDGAESAARALRNLAAALAPEIKREARIAPPPTPGLREIAINVCERRGVTLAEVLGDRRTKHISRVRQEVMAMAYDTGRFSYPKIGQYLGGRDHTTVLHGVRQFRARAAGRIP